jgi:GTP-binding protein
MVIVGTKADKLKPVEVEANAQIIKDALLETWEEVPPFIISSSETKQGHKEIWDVIKNAMKNG